MEIKFDRSVMLMIYGWSIMPVVLIQLYVIDSYELNVYLSPLYFLSIFAFIVATILMIKSINNYAIKVEDNKLIINNYLLRGKTEHDIKDIISYDEKSLKIMVKNKERVFYLYNISPDDKVNLIGKINEILEG